MLEMLYTIYMAGLFLVSVIELVILYFSDRQNSSIDRKDLSFNFSMFSILWPICVFLLLVSFLLVICRKTVRISVYGKTLSLPCRMNLFEKTPFSGI